MDIGRRVVQYDYVEAREERGTIVAVDTVYSRLVDADVDMATVEWDCGVTTRHPLDDFTAIAGRKELRCESDA